MSSAGQAGAHGAVVVTNQTGVVNRSPSSHSFW